MRRILILSVILLFAVFIANAQKNDALFNKVSKSFTLSEDGSQQMNVVKDITLYTYPSISTYGETFIIYNPKYQKLVINESYTIQKDGNKVITPENAFVPSLPYDAADAPAYNGLLEMVIVHTGIEIGATIHLDYTLTSSSDYLKELDIFEDIKESAPIKDFTLSISVPKGKTLNYSVLNAPSYREKKKTDASGLQTIVWNIKNVPASSHESMVSVAGGGIPKIAVNTYADGPHPEFCASDFKASFLPDFASVEEAVEYISENFDCIPLSFKDAGFRIRPLDEVVKSAYGTEMELTVLLDYSLRQMGVNSSIVAAYPVKKYDSSLGLSAASMYFITTDVPGKELISVSMTPREFSMIPRDYISLVSLKDGEVVPVPEYNTAIEKSEELKIAKSELDSVGAGYYLFTLPRETGVASWGLPLFSTRKDNFLLPCLIDESYTYSIDSGDTRFATPAKNIRITNKVGSMEETITTDGKAISVTRKLKFNTQLITPALYPDFLTLIKEWISKENTTFVFKAE